ncbi:hypothetical protein K438DRAFT_2027471, partial [Mycena galopus ATCC 62051]
MKSQASSTVEWDSPGYANIPELVRDVVGFEDDPAVATLTFRHLCVFGGIHRPVGVLSHHLGPFSVFFTVLVSWPLGRMMEKVLPDYRVPLGRLSFSLNLGPFSVKEHVLVGIAGKRARTETGLASPLTHPSILYRTRRSCLFPAYLPVNAGSATLMPVPTSTAPPFSQNPDPKKTRIRKKSTLSGIRGASQLVFFFF